jgi:hypothetical protein
MRKVAIQASSYIYFAAATIFGMVSIGSIFIDQSGHLFGALILAVVAAFCGFMGAKARSFLRMSPVPGRTQIGAGVGATFAVGALGGAWLMVLLFVPFALLVWAVQERQHDA